MIASVLTRRVGSERSRRAMLSGAGTVLLISFFASPARAAETMIDDFEGLPDAGVDAGPDAGSGMGWDVRAFGSAHGQLQLGPGHNGQGASLSTDFSAADAGASGEPWVAVHRHVEGLGEEIPPPLAVAFWARSDPGITLGLRVYCEADSPSNPTYSYKLQRPLSNLDPTQWYRHRVRLPTDSCPVTDIEIVAYDVQNNGAQAFPLSNIPSAFRTIAALQFDELAFTYDAFTVEVDPFRNVLPAPIGVSDLSDQFGVNSNNPSAYWDSADHAMLNHDLDAMKEAGIKWLRTDLLWSRNERQAGVYDFAEYEDLMLGARDRGMKILATLDYCNPLYVGCGNDPTLDGGVAPEKRYGASDPAARDAFGAYAKAAAEHFKSSTYSGLDVFYEVWNEPNQYWDLQYPDGGTGPGWTAEQKARQYAQLAAVAIAKIHEADPTAKVATAGIPTWDFQFLRNFLNEGMAGGASAVGTHPYRNPVSTSPARRTEPESFVDDLVLWRSIVETFVVNPPPVWTTEWGYRVSAADGETELVQAVHAVRMMLTTAVVGMPFSIWFQLRDFPSESSTAGYGLFGPNGEEQPALWALRQLGKTCRGRTFAGFLPIELSDVTGIRLDGPDDVVVVIWSSLPQALAQTTFVTLRTDGTVGTTVGATATTMWGSPVNLIQQGTSLSVPVSGDRGGPTFVTLKKTTLQDAGMDAEVDAPADSTAPRDAMGDRDATDNRDGAVNADSSVVRDAATDAIPSGGGFAQGSGEDSGCGCRTAQSPGQGARAFLLLSLLLLARRRRVSGRN
jgi:MYXO-CTERM domain-containing protein